MFNEGGFQILPYFHVGNGIKCSFMFDKNRFNVTIKAMSPKAVRSDVDMFQ